MNSRHLKFKNELHSFPTLLGNITIDDQKQVLNVLFQGFPFSQEALMRQATRIYGP